MITSQLIQFFKVHNITARVRIKDACLLILLESETLPDQEMSVAFIRGRFMNLEVGSFQSVQICGRERVEKHKSWKYSFEKLENEKFVLPLGCILESKSIELKQTKFNLRSKRIEILIKNNEKIVARADLLESKKTLELAKLTVEVKWRSRGIGSAIVKHIIQEYNKNIYLVCAINLTSFYSRLGFIQSGTPSLIATMVYFKK